MAGRETLDLYARNKAKLIALDHYFERSALPVGADGAPNGAVKVYWLAYNAAVRTLEGLRGGGR